MCKRVRKIFDVFIGEKRMKWTKQKAEEYIKKRKEKGLKYWSAKDYLKNHKTMTSII